MEYQVRRYRIAPGDMDQFVEAWRSGVVPLRVASGFVVVGGWRIDASDEFVWVLGYEGTEGFANADRRYYESQQRALLERDPAHFIVAGEEQAAVRIV